MIKVRLHNPTKVVTNYETHRGDKKRVESEGKDIVDYRVEEAELDQNGNLIKQPKPPYYKTTSRTLEWSIKAGETLDFPEYVAEYLLKRYEFLEVVGESSQEPESKEEAPVAVSKEGKVSCKYCGANFKNSKGLALHIAHKHSEKIL